MALPGLAIGLIAAAWLSRYASTLLHGITALDPLAFGAAAALMLSVTITAAAVPARRAARLDPVVALRHE
jgi:putative ABC transport system permease protein